NSGAPELYLGEAEAGRPCYGSRARSVFSWVAGHTPAGLQPTSHTGGHDSGATEDCWTMRWSTLRYGYARFAGHFRTNLGPPGAALLAESDRTGSRESTRLLLHG